MTFTSLNYNSNHTQALLNAPFWVFDLDNTLYHHSCNLFAEIDVHMSEYISRLVKLPYDEARVYQKKLFHTYGTTLRGLLMENKIDDPMDFLNHIHNIDYSVIEPDPLLDRALSALEVPKYILTNGPHSHAIHCLRRLGIIHHFVSDKEDRIFDTMDANLVPKPDVVPYEKFKEKYNLSSLREAVFVDDITHNLLIPHTMGMQTLWVNTENEHISGTPTDGDHVHYTTKSTTQFLAVLLGITDRY